VIRPRVLAEEKCASVLKSGKRLTLNSRRRYGSSYSVDAWLEWKCGIVRCMMPVEE